MRLSLEALKQRFETGDRPTGQDFIDLIDSLEDATALSEHLAASPAHNCLVNSFNKYNDVIVGGDNSIQNTLAFGGDILRALSGSSNSISGAIELDDSYFGKYILCSGTSYTVTLPTLNTGNYGRILFLYVNASGVVTINGKDYKNGEFVWLRAFSTAYVIINENNLSYYLTGVRNTDITVSTTNVWISTKMPFNTVTGSTLSNGGIVIPRTGDYLVDAWVKDSSSVVHKVGLSVYRDSTLLHTTWASSGNVGYAGQSVSIPMYFTKGSVAYLYGASDPVNVNLQGKLALVEIIN